MTVKELQSRFSQNLKNERKKALLTQEKLAEIADLSFQMINDIEGCRRANSMEEKNVSLSAKRIVAKEIENLITESINSYLDI